MIAGQSHPLAQHILDWLRDHAAMYGAEPSFKLTPGRLSTQRGIYGGSKRHVAGSPDGTLLALCQQLGMPEALQVRYREALPRCRHVGFGFDQEGEEQRYKAYLDFSSENLERAARALASEDDVLEFLGFKWCLTQPTQAVITEYRRHPLLTRRAMARRARDHLAALPEAQALVAAAFDQCARNWPERPLEYLEVREDASPRRSFDIKFYSTSITLGDLAAPLEALGTSLGVGAALADALRGQGISRLGHLAGGIDRHGTPFVMVYHGVQRQIMPLPTPPPAPG